MGYLVTRLGQKGTAHTLGLVTLRPRNIVTLGAYRVPFGQYLLGSVFAVVQIALFLLLLTLKSGGTGGEDFWILFGEIALGVVVFALVRYLLMVWTGFTFAEKDEADLWLANVVILFIFYGLSLTVPIALLIFVPSSVRVASWVGACLYLVYRIWFVGRGLAVMPKLRRSPLLIILYLCSCEIAPLYIAFSVTRTL